MPAIPTASAATIRADVAWRAGRPAAEILEILRPVEGRIPSGLWADEVFSQEHARFLRAEALHAAAEHDEALRWLEHGFVNSPGWVYYKPPVRHLKARIHEASARQDEARASREAFRVLWREADSPLGLPAASAGATP